jgi:hypothetical protein
MVPACFRGIGAFMRSTKYGVEPAKLGYTDFTANDMIEWNNAGYHLLAPKVVAMTPLPPKPPSATTP